jgi:hypothetical protein
VRSTDSQRWEPQTEPDRRGKGCLKPIGSVLLIVGAFAAGYACAPEKTVVRTKVQTQEKIVTDDAEIARLRKKLADVIAKKDAAIAQAEAALEAVRQELAAANAEIQRLLAELSARAAVESSADPRNASCPRCKAVFTISTSLVDHKENTRCPACHVIMSARSFVKYRDYMLNNQK